MERNKGNEVIPKKVLFGWFLTHKVDKKKNIARKALTNPVSALLASHSAKLAESQGLWHLAFLRGVNHRWKGQRAFKLVTAFVDGFLMHGRWRLNMPERWCHVLEHELSVFAASKDTGFTFETLDFQLINYLVFSWIWEISADYFSSKPHQKMNRPTSTKLHLLCFCLFEWSVAHRLELRKPRNKGGNPRVCARSKRPMSEGFICAACKHVFIDFKVISSGLGSAL